jgi:hypothetical protein
VSHILFSFVTFVFWWRSDEARTHRIRILGGGDNTSQCFPVFHSRYGRRIRAEPCQPWSCWGWLSGGAGVDRGMMRSTFPSVHILGGQVWRCIREVWLLRGNKLWDGLSAFGSDPPLLANQAGSPSPPGRSPAPGHGHDARTSPEYQPSSATPLPGNRHRESCSGGYLETVSTLASG